MELKYCHVIQTKEKSDLKSSFQLNLLMLMPTEINTNLWPMDTNAMRDTEKPIRHVSYRVSPFLTFYPIYLIFSTWIDEAQTIKTQPCTVQSEYARSLNGTYTISLIDFQIDNEEIFHLDFRIKGIKEDLQSRNVFRHKTFSELKS